MENHSMNFNGQFRIWSKTVAIDLCKFLEKFPFQDDTRIIKKQSNRSGSSLAANLLAACRAESDAEYYSKMCLIVKECD